MMPASNCWCYLIPGRRRGPVLLSDGEPREPTGQPMLEVFRRAGVGECLFCVVTRYFGRESSWAPAGCACGPIPGRPRTRWTRRASPRSVSGPRRWWNAPYPLLERVKLEIAAAQGVLGEVSSGAQVRLPALLPVEHWPAYAARITELTAGKIAAEKLGETFQAAPVEAR